MKLTVTLGFNEEENFDIELYNNPFVKKWVTELNWCLQNCNINQQEAFAGFFELDIAKQMLINACITINKYLKNFIDIRQDNSQNYYNYLHEKFEQLSGEFDKPTKLFRLANSELRQAIRNLNFYVHRVEQHKEFKHELYISFNKDQYRRKPLDYQDYQYSEFKLPAGTLYLQYVELGKGFFDLYKDKLPIDYKNFRNLHYFSGEARLALYEIDTFFDLKYLEWLKSNNINPFDKTLGHGQLVLGHVLDVQSVYNKIKKYQHLNKITIKELNHG